ncbi:beta-glucosidase [Amycolatopsis sp. WAC 01416]|uniref:glycoside hydrolase family 3 N-terminal domain-containing protein n=1 Tax=Amycolatopsis sp. WAC 01416 TaxID=2203196 RepID=UPI000F7B39FC|nr:glycoside hydrolase family 3 N-terminal domain-containing protein [Amycolatopsis sp. WAC 01416]RSN31877.1 beta-glucosidase [Amycolatopsis sp. WAC 01416]
MDDERNEPMNSGRPKTTKRWTTVILGAATVLLTSVQCGTTDDQAGSAQPAGTVPPPSSSVASSPSSSGKPAPSPSPRAEQAPAPGCEGIVAGMSPRQRLAQLVVVGVNAGDPQAAVKLVRDQQVGGIFLGGNETALLQNGALDEVQRAAKIPVSVAIDEEGGRVQRIDALDGNMPSARKMASTLTPAQVRKKAAERGRQMRARGVTVDYAPDADITDQPDRDIVGDRSFGSDPEVARKYVLAFAQGLRDAGVQPVLKHFPGHGHATGDSHKGLVRTPPLASLRKVDLVPYRDIGEYGEIGVMVGHLDVPDLTGGTPSTLSAPAYRLLRKDYAFDGPVITDDLGAMKAITSQYPLQTAVLKALQAGADQALWSSGGNVGTVLATLEQALASGDLPAARVDEAVTRVLAAKHACG